MAVTASCTPSRKEITADAVRRIRFVGNGGAFSGHNNLQLRRPMATAQSPLFTFTFPFMYFQTPSALNRQVLDADARRIEVWYAHHGWFDAMVNGWEIRRVRKRHPDRAGVVDILGHVVPGPPSYFRDLQLDLSQAGGASIIVSAPWRDLKPPSGTQFDLDRVERIVKTLEEELKNNTYAYAEITPTVDAYPEQREVDVTFDVVPGIQSKVGPLRIAGLERVPPSIVQRAIALSEGQRYTLANLRDAQTDLFNTDLFSLVDIRPDLSDRSNPRVPVDIELTEAKFRRFRFGGGVLYDYFTVKPRLTAELRDVWLFGTGIRFTLDGSAGAYVGVVRGDASNAILPTGEAGLSLEYPWLSFPLPGPDTTEDGVTRKPGRLTVFGSGRFQQDALFGSLPYWQITTRAGVRLGFTRDISLTLNPTFDYYRYLEPGDDTLTAARAQFGGDFTGSTFQLLSLDALARGDFRNDPIQTTRGYYLEFAVRQSIPIPSFSSLGSSSSLPDQGFLYTKLDGEARGWIQPFYNRRKGRRIPIVLGARVHAIGILPWDAGDPLPYPDLAFLGGPNSLRGFRDRQVGPYDALCSYRSGRPNPQHNNGRAYDVTRTYLPKGGSAAAEVQTELRYDWPFGLSFAVFGEVGILANRWPDLSADKFRGDAGVGLRYLSPVGPIRLDLAFRPVFPEDRGPARYIGCNPIDRVPRGYDIITAGFTARENLRNQTFPVAIQLVLAINEAF